MYPVVVREEVLLELELVLDRETEILLRLLLIVKSELVIASTSCFPLPVATNTTLAT